MTNLWSPGQEWIQIFARLLSYRSNRRRGCSLARCQARHGTTVADDEDTDGDIISDLHDDSFILEFPAPVMTRTESQIQVVTILRGLMSVDWRRRVKSLELVRCLVSYGGEQLDECLASLAERTDTVKGCLVDSRTQVVRDCCLTVAYLAYEGGYKAVPVILHLLPLLIKLLQHKSKFIISSSAMCIRFIIQYTFSSRFAPILCSGVFCKSKVVRSLTQEFLSHMLHTWPLHILHAQLHTIQAALQAGLVDVDASTRLKARSTFWAFSGHFYEEADTLLGWVVRCPLSVISESSECVSARRAQVRKEYADMHRARARRRGTRQARTEHNSSITDSVMTWSSMSMQETDSGGVDDCNTLQRILGTPDSMDSGIAQGLLHTDDDTEDGDEAAPVQAILGHSIVKHTRPTLATFILDLLSVLTKGSIEESLSAARYLVKVVQVVDKEQVKEQLKEIVMELKKAYEHHQPRVRRCAVTCLASLSRLVGHSVIYTLLGQIRGDKKRLLRLYIERAKEGELVEYRTM